MTHLSDVPLLAFVVAFVLQWLAARAGIALRRRRGAVSTENAEEFSVILAATLTLLGLIIGFSFSMATSRYDQRKNLEEAEANAIGTEYVRAELLAPADAVHIKALLKTYLDQRVQFYADGDDAQRSRVNAAVNALQGQLWTAVKVPAMAAPSAISALVVTGMNDVINAQGYTQAALWNRIPHAAWLLMVAIALCCNFLIGYRWSRSVRHGGPLLLVLPLVASVAFLLIADIDSPRHGLIRVVPQNLLSLADALRTQ